MRIGIAQINPALGDFKNNADKIQAFIREAAAKKCSLVVFPECALFGYHPFDLLERGAAVDLQLKELKRLTAALPAGMAALVGVITKNPSALGRPYFNSAAFLVKGKTPRFFHKTLLPTGDVFDEARFIESGDVRKNVLKWRGKKILLTICEDIWAWPENGRSPYRENPLRGIPRAGWDLVINLSASPWHVGKMKARERVTAATAAWFRAPLLYANLVGAQDEIIFDGRSFVIDAKGRKRVESLGFEEQLNVFDSETLESWTPAPQVEETEELRRALVLGLRDFIEKTGLKRVHLGLSGGIDSAVVACLAVDALGPGRVAGFGLPGPFSAPESLKWAKELAGNLGVDFKVLEMKPAYELMSRIIGDGLGIKEFGLVHENLQARLRGILLMAEGNRSGSLLLSTGNKSELATGYTTLYGDMCGGLAPIGDLTKKQVYDLARLYNRDQEIIPNGVIDRAPSAELRANQKDQDSLPPYDELDRAVVRMVEKLAQPRTATEKWVLAQVHKTEFKRWQAPPILKASSHSFGRGRRYPLAHRFTEK